jgi:hypothetical protein
MGFPGLVPDGPTGGSCPRRVDAVTPMPDATCGRSHYGRRRCRIDPRAKACRLCLQKQAWPIADVASNMFGWLFALGWLTFALARWSLT